MSAMSYSIYTVPQIRKCYTLITIKSIRHWYQIGNKQYESIELYVVAFNIVNYLRNNRCDTTHKTTTTLAEYHSQYRPYGCPPFAQASFVSMSTALINLYSRLSWVNWNYRYLPGKYSVSAPVASGPAIIKPSNAASMVKRGISKCDGKVVMIEIGIEYERMVAKQIW